jgi:hypothetical protein
VKTSSRLEAREGEAPAEPARREARPPAGVPGALSFAWSARGRILLLAALLVPLSPGCGAGGPETEYGLSRGTSLNGTRAFAAMLRNRGHTVKAAIRLTDGLAEWAQGIVRFAPYPGPPESGEAH